MNYLRVKNWDEFQHYKDRSPPWIKLHRSLLDDYDFCALPDATKGQLMLIWVFASQNEGKIPQDAKFLERKLGLSQKCELQQMVDAGFLVPEQPDSSSDSGPLAGSKQDDSEALALARSREERQRTKATEAERRARDFARFWSIYPRKTSKPDAEKAWEKLAPASELVDVILAAVTSHSASEQWLKNDGQFIPHPSTWLNKRRWEDEGTKIAAPQSAGERMVTGGMESWK